jgi:hypothetical protein
MTEDKIQEFFQSHKEIVPDDAFQARLFNTLDCLPMPQARPSRTPLVVAGSTIIGFLLFVLFGGFGILLDGLSGLGSVFVDTKAFTPNVITACIFLVLLFAALTGFAVRSYRR